MANMVKLYIAFSINGTHAFIRANKEVTEANYRAMLKSGEFSPLVSRRPGYNAIKDGIKLSWKQLNTVEGKPLRSVPRVLNRFKLLAAQGWTVDKTDFVERHYRHGRHA